jgi:hypothetical protein
MKTKSFKSYADKRLTKDEQKQLKSEAKKEYREFQETIKENLHIPAFALAYLKECSDNPQAFIIALKDILSALESCVIDIEFE